MNIRDRRGLKQAAASSLAAAPGEKTLIAAYVGGSSLLALVLSLADLWLNSVIENTSGLSNFGTRSIWQTVQNVLPILQTLAVIGWNFGYRRAIMDIRSGRVVAPRNLLDAFAHIWPILRLTLLQYLIFAGLWLLCIYVGVMIFLATPFSDSLMAQLEPLMTQSSLLPGNLQLTDALMDSLYSAILPLSLVILVLCAGVSLPIYYSMRMAPYILLETPQIRARYALAGSRRMLRRNRWQLFRLDLSFWWYYLLELMATALCYGDLLLPLLGITLPFGEVANSYLFFMLYLLAQFGISYAFQNSIELTYVEAYESLKPKPQNDGVVLGNIFQM